MPPTRATGRVRGRRGGRSRGRGRHIGHSGRPARDPAPSRDPAPGPAAIARADPTGAHTVTGAQRRGYAVAVGGYTVAVAVVRAGPAGHHTFAIAAPGLTQPLTNHLGVPAPHANAYA